MSEASAGDNGLLRPDWRVPRGVRACVTTRGFAGVSRPPFEHANLGDRCGDSADDVAVNRMLLVDRAVLPAPPRWLRQVHGTDVHLASPDPDAPTAPVADAAFTRTPGVVLAVLTADCLPLLVCDDTGSEVAAIHAGWRGLAAGVIEATLRHFSAAPSRLHAWLGPAIAARSYEVGEEVRAVFLAHDAAAAQAFTATRPGHWLCDLYALARQRLAASGVARIAGGDFDTFTDERFYSHRRSRPTGRFASLIWIEAGEADASREPAPAALRAPTGSRAQANAQASASTSPHGPANDASPADGGATASSRLFPRLLGSAFAQLPPRVRALHLAPGTRRYRGAATVTRGTSLLARLCGRATGLPPPMHGAPLDVELIAQPRGEQWTRHFGQHAMRSRLWGHAGLLCERLGLVTFGFALAVEDSVLTWRVRRVHALGLPLPAAWFGGVYAREFEQDGRYRFEVAAALPLAGQLVHYAGWLDVD